MNTLQDLEFKKDLGQARDFWDAFWKGRQLGRPALYIVVPKLGFSGVEMPYPVRPDQPLEPLIAAIEGYGLSRHFLAEAIPFFMMEFGPEHFANFLGAEMRYGSNTGWIVPCVENWDDFEIRLHAESAPWLKTIEIIRTLRERLGGKLFINMPVLSAGLDALSALRGPEKLLMDLADCPEKIAAALKKVCAVYDEVVKGMAEVCDWDRTGSLNWNGMYHPGRINTIQCDCSGMISPDLFRELAIPCLVHEASHYQAVTYHLDGPQALKHLEALCALPELDVIQYMPGLQETKEAIENTYHRIASLGKGVVVVRGADPEMVRRIWNEFPDRKLVFHMTFPTVKEAEKFIASF